MIYQEDAIKAKAYAMFTEVFKEYQIIINKEKEARNQQKSPLEFKDQDRLYHQILHEFVEYIFRCSRYKEEIEKPRLLAEFFEQLLPQNLAKKLEYKFLIKESNSRKILA